MLKNIFQTESFNEATGFLCVHIAFSFCITQCTPCQHTYLYLIMIPQMLMNVMYNKAKNRFIPIQNNKNEEWLFAYKLYIPEKDIVSIILSTIINRICLSVLTRKASKRLFLSSSRYTQFKT